MPERWVGHGVIAQQVIHRPVDGPLQISLHAYPAAFYFGSIGRGIERKKPGTVVRLQRHAVGIGGAAYLKRRRR